VGVLQQGLRQQLTAELRGQGGYNYNALDTINRRCIKTGELVYVFMGFYYAGEPIWRRRGAGLNVAGELIVHVYSSTFTSRLH
jgi:hypothetical protein